MSNISERMQKIFGNTTETPNLPEEQESATSGVEHEILSSLALAAVSSGIDMDDDDALDKFVADVKTAVTKDKAKLKSILRRFTSSKAKNAAKQTIKNA